MERRRSSSGELDLRDITLINSDSELEHFSAERIRESVLIIRDIYLVKKWLGKGKFGVVYQAVDITDDQLVAIKVEKADAEYSSIKHEVRIMNYLFQHKFRELPKIHWYGVQSGLTHLVMCYYDQCLESLEHLSVDHIRQCIRILKSIHDIFVIHRDIKPHNFMLRNNKLYLIDYGLATFFVDEEGEHVPDKKQAMITGTPKFVSYYNHIGHTLSRRDDLISLGYLFIYMVNKKRVPWSMSSGPDVLRITKMKTWENISILTQGFSPLHEYMKYCYSLEYDDDPDHDYLSALFC
jgi:serine/threonine protein kinase